MSTSPGASAGDEAVGLSPEKVGGQRCFQATSVQNLSRSAHTLLTDPLRMCFPHGEGQSLQQPFGLHHNNSRAVHDQRSYLNALSTIMHAAVSLLSTTNEETEMASKSPHGLIGKRRIRIRLYAIADCGCSADHRSWRVVALSAGARTVGQIVIRCVMMKVKETECMAAVEDKLTFPEFQSKYEHSDRSYEYWHGEAIPKGMPTWVHGLLQRIVMALLTEAGYIAGSEVELRIVPDAHPKPDVIATNGEVEEPYPTKAVEVVVEILSEDDPMAYVLEKCQAYQNWGFEYIYVVNPESRQVLRWIGTALEITSELTSIPAVRIWEQLDEAMHRQR
jgi:Uma2 family endonuclease